jgi:competence ComEA-like helix-hairpin-helix protein
MRKAGRILLLFIALSVFAGIGGFVWAVEADKVNINTASEKELTQLGGIGVAKAAEIVKYRESNGPFGSPEDLMNVKGIGPKTFESNKDRIAVGKPDTEISEETKGSVKEKASEESDKNVPEETKVSEEKAVPSDTKFSEEEKSSGKEKVSEEKTGQSENNVSEEKKEVSKKSI